MLMMTEFFVNTQAGFRGVSKISAELAAYFNLKSVSATCLRQWILRLGYGILNMEVEKRSDWVYIIDFSISLGNQKCLLILGVTMETITTFGYELNHENLCVLDIFVSDYFNATIIFDRLTKTTNKTGSPYQIVSDNGSDLSRGIELFCSSNEDTIRTYDISHLIGICIKHSLAENSQWLDLQHDLGNLAQQVKQTDVSFLRPIALSKKARWLNIQNELIWLKNIYEYESEGNFDLICTGFKINNVEEVFEENKAFFINKKAEKRIRKIMKSTVFQNEEELVQFLTNNGIIFRQNIQIINAGKVRFIEKFNILDKHKKYFLELQELNEVTKSIKDNIKKNGLDINSLENIKPEEVNTNWVKDICIDIKNRLKIQFSKFNKKEVSQTVEKQENDLVKKPILCCSDIIESVFGKFKMKSNQSVGGIYSSVLSIALFCIPLTADLVREILTKTKMSDVNKWFTKMAGRSNLSKRKEAFANNTRNKT
jgi:hypothetical protein